MATTKVETSSPAPDKETKPVLTERRSTYIRGPSKELWARYKPLVKRMYVDEGKTLKEVMTIMEREHRFIAS